MGKGKPIGNRSMEMVNRQSAKVDGQSVMG
jgi:hypothetical protein